MNRGRRSSFATGLVLILIGVLVLVAQLVPGWDTWFAWPLYIVGIGAVLLLIGLLTRVPALAIPACIVAGIGGDYEPETLVGKQIVLLSNLQPAKIRGIESKGMLLAASAGDKVLLVTLDGETTPGSEIS